MSPVVRRDFSSQRFKINYNTRPLSYRFSLKKKTLCKDSKAPKAARQNCLTQKSPLIFTNIYSQKPASIAAPADSSWCQNCHRLGFSSPDSSFPSVLSSYTPYCFQTLPCSLPLCFSLLSLWSWMSFSHPSALLMYTLAATESWVLSLNGKKKITQVSLLQNFVDFTCFHYHVNLFQIVLNWMTVCFTWFA